MSHGCAFTSKTCDVCDMRKHCDIATALETAQAAAVEQESLRERLYDKRAVEDDGVVSLMEGRRILTKLGWTPCIDRPSWDTWTSPDEPGSGSLSINIVSALGFYGYELADEYRCPCGEFSAAAHDGSGCGDTDASEEAAPKTLDDAIVFLAENLSDEDVEHIKECQEEGMAKYHHHLGRRLRNEWGLWTGGPLARYFNDMGVTHADDMSCIILTSLWRHMHDKPIKLDEQVAFYKKYWEKMGAKKSNAEDA